jgi:hypothetical protein
MLAVKLEQVHVLACSNNFTSAGVPPVQVVHPRHVRVHQNQATVEVVWVNIRFQSNLRVVEVVTGLVDVFVAQLQLPVKPVEEAWPVRILFAQITHVPVL